MRIPRRPPAFLPLLLLAAPALAESAPNAAGPERYAFQPAEGGGYLRLDTSSGAVSYCASKEGMAVCRLGADERAAFEAEIARLRDENARLKTLQTPTIAPGEEEFERALGFTERFLRRIIRLFKDESPTNGRL